MKANKILTAILIITTTIVACHKDPVIPPEPPIAAAGLKVKDISERNLPSPYYHFEYDDSGKITLLNYQSGLRIFEIKYNGENIVSMENRVGPVGDIKLEYVYVNGEFVGIKVKNRNGEVVENCIVSYNSSHQLQEIEWDISDGSTGFLIEQTLTYSYYPDGNVMEVVTHNYPIAPQTEAIYTDRFENYDDHVNADGFSLANNSTHEPILLPGTKIQLNNPRRIIRTGDGINFEINFTYTYDSKGRPTVKTGDVLSTNGSNAGQHFQSQSTFSYYD
ncbi:MAG TPA: hypothetical protein VGQ53_24085 [Chitinophagaceae bacterium]|nr:hypothetical protein [Chitinophagaceae bacterium]